MKMKNFLLSCAKEAGKIHLKYFNKIGKVSLKAKGDFFTKADLESEQKIKEMLQKEFPDYEIFAEESGYSGSKSDYVWLVDPLDGTTNFLLGMSYFCTSIGLAYKKEVILGLVFNPFSKQVFYAEQNKGAFLNDKKIKVSKTTSLTDSIFLIDWGREGKNILQGLDIFKKLLKPVKKIRPNSACALDMCNLAMGNIQGIYSMSSKPWDQAAGSIMIKEAQGFIVEQNGKQFDVMQDGFIATCNEKLYTKLLEVLKP